MTLGQLLSKDKINLDTKTKTFCDRGLDLMREAKDPAHNIRHIERMFSDFDRFLRENSKLELDFETLLISISWHDVWMAMNFKPDLFLLWKAQIEGREAAKLVFKEMEKYGFKKTFVEKVVYCIERHTGPDSNPIKRKTLESRVLHDLDQMDSWSAGRLQEIKDYLLKSVLGRLFLALLKTKTGRRSILKAADHEFYYQSSQEERNRRYPGFQKKVEELFG